jgi:prepilin-type N-terminal cleavage/methylation domain-containing protein/prepilin-type processing-associated H-X9-DG protein
MEPRRTRRRQPVGFTLMELLTVISVIAIIAALLFPAVNSALNKAKDIECTSNMRQIHTAIYLYAGDHDQIFPMLTVPTWEHQYEQLALLRSYIPNEDVFRCPLARGDTAQGLPMADWFGYDDGGVWRWTEYKINDYNRSDPPGTVGKPLDSHLRPSMVVFVIDGMDGTPRHRGRSNIAYQDGRIQLTKYEDYHNGLSAPEPGTSGLGPTEWYAWGIDPY